MTNAAVLASPALRDLAERAPIKAHGCMVGILAGAAVLGGFLARSWLLPRSGLSVVVAAVLMTLVVVARRPGAVVFERVFVPVALVPAAAAVAVAAWVEVGWPWMGKEAFGAWEMEAHGYLALAVPVVALSAAVVGGTLARRLTAVSTGPLRSLAWAAALLSAGLVVSGMRRQQTAEGYLAGLPVIATIPAPPEDARPGWLDDRILGDLRLRREIKAQSGCALFLASRAGDEPRPAWRSVGCGPIAVRADQAHGVWILEGPAGRVWVPGGSARVPGAYPQSVSGPLRPPGAYLALAALGVLAAILALLGRPGSPVPAGVGGWREATASADGTLVFHDDTPPLALPGGASVREGPVVALLGTPPGSFREHAAPAVLDVASGTLAEHRLARLGPPAFALAFVTLAATPLTVALWALR